MANHLTPEELSKEYDLKREEVIRLCHGRLGSRCLVARWTRKTCLLVVGLGGRKREKKKKKDKDDDSRSKQADKAKALTLVSPSL